MAAMRFEILKSIKSGGLADVLLVQTGQGRFYALKRLQAGKSDTAAARFRHEIRIQSMLSHPHIVPVVAADADAPLPFYVMPLAKGSLEDLVPSIVAEPGRLIAIIDQVLSALAYAHDQNVLHRDLKPKNILLFDKKCAIADFGLGKAPNIKNSHDTRADEWGGTAWYMPPEQLRCLADCTPASDVYGVGKVILQCLTGGKPNEIPFQIDGRWQYLLRRCLRDDPSARWNSAQELYRQFRFVFGLDTEQLPLDPLNTLDEIRSLAHMESISAETIEKLARNLATFVDNEVLLQRVFSQLPSNVIRAWNTSDPLGMQQLVERFDATLSDQLPFEFCDTVADQYARVYKTSANVETRELIRRRLFRLGPQHNRWHAGRVFAQIVAMTEEAGEVASIAAMLEENVRWAKWHQQYFQAASVPDSTLFRILPPGTCEGK